MLIIIVFLILQIHVEDHFVLYITISGELDAECVPATIKRFLEHRPVSNIKENGINMFRIIATTAIRELGECYNDLEKGYHGSQLLRSIYNHMMNLLQKHKGQIILVPLDFTV